MNNGELYLQHLDRVTGRAEDVIRKVESSDPTLPSIAIFVYKDWPEAGFITGFTMGLSAVIHPDWKFGRPELMISVESTDEAWLFAVGYMADDCGAIALFATATQSTSTRKSVKNRTWMRS